MRLSDIVSGADLSLYPKLALVLFLIAFTAVVRRTYSSRWKDAMTKAGSMALDDGIVEARVTNLGTTRTESASKKG